MQKDEKVFFARAATSNSQQLPSLSQIVKKMNDSEPSDVHALITNLKVMLDSGAVIKPERWNDTTLRSCFGLRGVCYFDGEGEITAATSGTPVSMIRASDFGPIFLQLPSSSPSGTQFAMNFTESSGKRSGRLLITIPTGSVYFSLVEEVFGNTWEIMPPLPIPNRNLAPRSAPLGNQDLLFHFEAAGIRGEMVVGLYPDASVQVFVATASSE